MEILIALATATALLIPTLLLVLLASMAAANRGEIASGHHETATEGAGEAKPGFSLGPARDPFVLEILLLGAVLFGLTMALLLGVSLMGQI
jgi:hypothetical protein